MFLQKLKAFSSLLKNCSQAPQTTGKVERKIGLKSDEYKTIGFHAPERKEKNSKCNLYLFIGPKSRLKLNCIIGAKARLLLLKFNNLILYEVEDIFKIFHRNAPVKML